MSRSHVELAELIAAEPLDEELRLELEQLLLDEDVASVAGGIMIRERLIGESLALGLSAIELIEEYREFCILNSYRLWDVRGFTEHVFRPFSLWLIQVCEPQANALSMALEIKIGETISVSDLPKRILTKSRPDLLLDALNGIKDFLRRYNGSTGERSISEGSEVVMRILPGWLCL